MTQTMNAVQTPSLPNSSNITRVELENGIVVLVYENHAAQSVVLSGSLRAGGLYETAERAGLAALTASALMRGTTTRDFNAIHSELEDIGADLGVSGGTYRASFYGKALAEDLATLLDVLSDVLHNPTFPEGQVERLRGEVLTGLQIRQQDTRFRASRAFTEALYPPDHPLYRSTRGTLETVPTLAIEEMRQFHARHYGPDGMIIVIVGAVSAAEAVELVRLRFADWENPNQPVQPLVPEVPLNATTKRAAVALPGKTQSDIVLGLLGPSRLDNDYYAAMLANSILGQFGMMGRIGASVREELGLAYYAYSQLDAGLGRGPWSVVAGVNPANVDLAIARIGDELRRLITEKVSNNDLADNKAYYIGHLPLQLESNEGIAGTILNMELYGLGMDYLVRYAETINELTAEQLLDAAKRYLDPDRLVIGIAGPAMKSGE